MKNKYWIECSKTAMEAEKCVFCEQHLYIMQGHQYDSKYICRLNDWEECPYYGSKEHNSKM